MRLRYLHIKELPPLKNVPLTFGLETLLKRNLAIRFLVGVNGTGKTRLLQALTEVFISIGRGRQPLPFPVTLAYDLGVPSARTIFLHYPGGAHSNTVLIEFDKQIPKDVDWRTLQNINWEQEDNPLGLFVRNRFLTGELPSTASIEAFIPAPLIVYTSGDTISWQEIFSQGLIGPDFDITDINLQDEAIDERPSGWNIWKEQDYQRSIGGSPPSVPPDSVGVFNINQIGSLLTIEQLKLAMCAVTLHHAIRMWNQTSDSTAPDENLEALLREVGWEDPIALTLQIKYQLENLLESQRAQLHDLYQIASSITREPEPDNTRQLSFDLRRVIPDSTDYLILNPDTPRLTIEALIEILGGENASPFDVFQGLSRLCQDDVLIDLTLAIRWLNLEDLLLYDWLSDGERMFLGRIALFYLLQNEEDALLILDEPETHFNDTWKRRLVDTIDDALKNQASEVVISTHSSIALTDVFAEEIELLKKENGEAVVGRISTPTFGADPSEIMINVFDAPDSIGKRALEYLDKLLEYDWSEEEIDKLEYFIRHIGPGYHRSELRTIWRKLRATQDQPS